MAEPLIDALLDIIDAYSSDSLTRSVRRRQLEGQLQDAINSAVKDQITLYAQNCDNDDIYKLMEKKFPDVFPEGWVNED